MAASPIMTARRGALRRPVVRGALAYAVLAPALVAAGPAAQGEPRLRVVGLALAAVPALVWEDRCAPLTAATPVGLPAVRRDLLAPACALLAGGWGGAALLAGRAGGEVPVGRLALESFGVALLVLAIVGLLVRGREGEPSAAYPVPVLLVGLVLLSRLPQGWGLLLTPGAPVDARWAATVAACGLTLWWTARDPAGRPLRRLLDGALDHERARPGPSGEGRAGRDVRVSTTTSRRRRSG